MSRFTFAAGNAAKLFAAPAYALGSIATRIVPRRDNLWVFGSGSGFGEGSRALALEVLRRDPQARVVWLGGDDAEVREARAAGIRSYRRRSWRGLRATLRARVIGVTHGYGDVNRFVARGAFVVQLWHGIPLKLIQLDAAVTFSSNAPFAQGVLAGLLRRLYLRSTRGISLMPAASNVSAERLRSAFGIPAERVVVTGDPRDDVLCQGTPDERRAAARALLAAELPPGTVTESTRLMMHAPTWRDGEHDPTLPADEEWALLDEWLTRNDTVLVLRPHQHSVGDYALGPARSSRIVLLDSTIRRDINPVLAGIDLLITDYSSIAYDYALIGNPVLFLAPDMEHYTATRGLYQDYHEYSGAMEVNSWAALLARLDRMRADVAYDRLHRDHADRLASLNHAYRDGRNTQRVYAAIRQRLNPPTGVR